jgi:hypothetical protein
MDIKKLKKAFEDEIEDMKKRNGVGVVFSERGPFGVRTVGALVEAVEQLNKEVEELKKKNRDVRTME